MKFSRLRSPFRQAVWLLLLYVSHCQTLYAYQTTNTLVDSLQLQLQNRKLSDSARIECLNRLAREFAYISSAQASDYAQQALKLSLKTRNLSGQAYAYRNLGSIYSVQESFYLSLEFTSKAIQLFEKLKDSTGIGNCYITLGHTYKRQEDYPQAIAFHSRAVTIFRRQQLPERLAVSLHNLGEAELLAGKLALARTHTLEAIQLCQRLHNQSVLSACLRVIGVICYNANDFDQAKSYFLQVMSLSENLGSNAQKEATIESLIYLSKLAQRDKQDARQIGYLKQAIQLANQSNFQPLIRTAYHLAGEYYLSHNDVKAAKALLDEYVTINSQLIRWQNKDKASMVETVLKALKASEQNAFLLQQDELKKQVIQSQKKQIYWISALSVLLVIVLGVVLYYFSLHKKLTRQVLAQNTTIEQNARQIQESATKMEENARKLEQMNQAKNKFFKIVAHDLVSPLSSMSGVTAMLSEDIDSLSKEETGWVIRQWNQSLHSTLELAHNLINWAHSQMEANPPHQQVVSLYMLVEKVKSTYAPIAYQKQIHLDMQIPDVTQTGTMQIYANADQIEFVLRNLVNNALKFTPRRGQVSIGLLQDATSVTFVVKDSGVGMTNEKIERLFSIDKLDRTQGTEGEQGSGLGLVLCQEFIQKNGGAISVESQPGAGTTFFVRLRKPVQALAATAPPHTSTVSMSS